MASLVLTMLTPGLAVTSERPRVIEYDGVVVVQASSKPIANAVIHAVDIDGRGLLAPPAIRVMEETRSDARGRFELSTVGQADEIRAFTEERHPYRGAVEIRRGAKRRGLVVEINPQLGISTYQGCPNATSTEFADPWKTASRARRALLKILAHHDSSGASLQSLEDYYRGGTITAKELALFQEYRDVFNQPCDTRGEARLVWGRNAFGYLAIDEPVSFVNEDRCGDCITSR
jgi:hypothetical protein